MEGGVSRAVDFNLKKEDLMLLILEGRKEHMEEEIAKIQTVSTTLKKELQEAEKALEKKIRKLCMATLNPEAKKLAKAFSISEDEKEMSIEEEDEDENASTQFKLSLSRKTEYVEYTKYSSKAIGDGKGGTYIKQQNQQNVEFDIFYRMQLSLALSLHGRVFLKKEEILKSSEVRACNEYSRDFQIADETLDVEFQRTLPEYKACKDIATKLASNESILSDILAEYDLFNRNQPRAKAKMIKEVLSRDDAGQALLGNIMTAASGVKLLGDAKAE